MHALHLSPSDYSKNEIHRNHPQALANQKKRRERIRDETQRHRYKARENAHKKSHLIGWKKHWSP